MTIATKASLVAAVMAAALLPRLSLADTHTTGVPQLSSDPGAPYTIYLDYAGFNYTGTWSGYTPGNTPAFDNVTGSFNSDQQAEVSRLWAGVAQAYTPFNINVTTVDPAVAAGQAATDSLRQAYYDRTPDLEHTVVGPEQNNWYGDYGGASYVGVTQNSYATAGYNSGAGMGYHTNWNFADTWWTEHDVVQPGMHENGHGLGLNHQSDYQGSTEISEYSYGDNATQAGSYAPIMGASYNTQRSAWRLGDSVAGASHMQNDVAVILGNSGIGGLVNDGIGHSLATATPLPLSGSAVDFTRAKGVITPASSSAPTPMGAANYTTDFFSFYANGGPISLTAYDGSEFLAPGTPDPDPMLRSTLTILNHAGQVVGASAEDASTLFEMYSSTLAAGDYYAEIGSYGGHAQTLTESGATMNTTYYYDMGSYFLTGSGFAAPEPGTLTMLSFAALVGVLWLSHRRAAN